MHDRASLVAQRIKNLPAMQETRVRSLGWEDPLEEEEMATHSIILAWRIPSTEEAGRLRSMGRKELDRTEPLSMHAYSDEGSWCPGYLFLTFSGNIRKTNTALSVRVTVRAGPPPPFLFLFLLASPWFCHDGLHSL